MSKFQKKFGENFRNFIWISLWKMNLKWSFWKKYFVLQYFLKLFSKKWNVWKWINGRKGMNIFLLISKGYSSDNLNQKEPLISLNDSNHSDIWPEIQSDIFWCKTLEIKKFQKTANHTFTDMNQFLKIKFSKQYLQCQYLLQNNEKLCEKIKKKSNEIFEKHFEKFFRKLYIWNTVFWKKLKIIFEKEMKLSEIVQWKLRHFYILDTMKPITRTCISQKKHSIPLYDSIHLRKLEQWHLIPTGMNNGLKIYISEK